MASAPAGQEAQPDPEIEALLEFEPVPRKRAVEGGWTPELQREFIALLAVHGSAGRACAEMGKNHTGIMKLYRSPLGASFREAWDGAVELARRRSAEAARAQRVAPGTVPPTLDHRRRQPWAAPGRGVNQLDEWEDEEALARRADEVLDSITNKLLRARRLYLADICDSPGKRAAFEILTDLPIDWDKAAKMEPQDDEPWRQVNMRQPDMLLTCENGWANDIAHAVVPDRMADLRRLLDEHYAKEGLPGIQWDEEGSEEDER